MNKRLLTSKPPAFLPVTILPAELSSSAGANAPNRSDTTCASCEKTALLIKTDSIFPFSSGLQNYSGGTSGIRLNFHLSKSNA